MENRNTIIWAPDKIVLIGDYDNSSILNSNVGIYDLKPFLMHSDRIAPWYGMPRKELEALIDKEGGVLVPFRDLKQVRVYGNPVYRNPELYDRVQFGIPEKQVFWGRGDIALEFRLGYGEKVLNRNARFQEIKSAPRQTVDDGFKLDVSVLS